MSIARLKSLWIKLTWKFWPQWRLRVSGAKVGKNIFLGEQVYIELENAKHLTVDDGVVVAAFSKIILHDSSLNNINGFDLLYGKVHLRRNVYIGADVTILPGSDVGENTIVGAGSLVKGVLKSNSVYFGRPAKYYCSLNELTKKWQRLKNSKENIFEFVAKKSPYQL